MTTSSDKEHFLDKPIFQVRRDHLFYAALILFIFCTRLWDLGPRSYSHDEAIHAWESWRLATGQGYVHDPPYHGPFLYHLTAALFVLFGDGEYVGRLGAAIFGIALTLLPLMLRRWLGRWGTLMAMLFMAISPVLMHRSRFLRHDPFAATFNLLLLIAILRYLYEQRSRDLYLAASALSLGVCTKETSFIAYFLFGTFLVGWALTSWLRGRERTWRALTALPTYDLILMMGTLLLPLASPLAIRLLGHDPLDLSPTGITFSAIVFGVILVISILIGLLWDRRRWPICAAFFYGIFVPLYTTFFTNGQGFATGMVGQLGYWLSQQGVKRGGQPWFYYLILMPMYEFGPLLIGLGGIVYVTIRGIRRDRSGIPFAEASRGTIPLVPLLILWALGAFVLYSWAGEKMPWLTMHLALPWHLLAGWTVGQLLERDWATVRAARGWWLLLLLPLWIGALATLLLPWLGIPIAPTGMNAPMTRWIAFAAVVLLGYGVFHYAENIGNAQALRLAAFALIGVLMLLTVRFAWMATFAHGDVANEFLVYAQGAPDVGRVARQLTAMSYRLTGGLDITVAYDQDAGWPFVWYLRHFTRGQYFEKPNDSLLQADVVLVGEDTDDAVRPMLQEGYRRYRYRLIWWPYQDWYIEWTPKTFWAELRSPEGRTRFWNVVWRREYPVPLAEWPDHLVHYFYLYVREELVEDLWASTCP